MKTLLLLLAAVASVGCTNPVDPRPTPPPAPPADYCDWRAGDWNRPDCNSITYQGVYGQDAAYICPQDDGSTWRIRTQTLAPGGTETLAERYVPGSDGAPPRMLCVASASAGGPILFQDDAAICNVPGACP